MADDSHKVALVADDDEFFRMALSLILKGQLGFAEVLETGSLDEALDQLGGDRPIALALFDLSMPGMESAASLGAVRELHPETRVAVVSGSKRRRDILLALETGVHGYVVKGVGPADLARAIGLILEGFVYVPPSLADLSVGAEPAGRAAEAPTAEGGAEPVELQRLTPRQREVLELIVSGRSNKEIARALNLGEGTIKIHLAAVFRNLGVANRSAAAAAGARLLAGPGRP